MTPNELSPEEIKEAFEELTQRQLKLLISIYNMPGSMITSKELKIKYRQSATEIGNIGKKLGVYCRVDDFGSYANGKRKGFSVAYFRMVGEYHENYGWLMNHNLRMAIKDHLKVNKTKSTK
ncbi:hypothetical protein BH09BAC3_BH09BAC3_38270 [soil metagenome]